MFICLSMFYDMICSSSHVICPYFMECLIDCSNSLLQLHVHMITCVCLHRFVCVNGRLDSLTLNFLWLWAFISFLFHFFQTRTTGPFTIWCRSRTRTTSPRCSSSTRPRGRAGPTRWFRRTLMFDCDISAPPPGSTPPPFPSIGKRRSRSCRKWD
jgi:hypothetical protein